MTQEKQMLPTVALVFYFLNSRTRADALRCLLTQAVHSLMTQEKQMPPTVALVSLF